MSIHPCRHSVRMYRCRPQARHAFCGMVLGLALLACPPPATGSERGETVVPGNKIRIHTVGVPMQGGWHIDSDGDVMEWFEADEPIDASITIRASGRLAGMEPPHALMRVGGTAAIFLAKEFDVPNEAFKDFTFQVHVPRGLFAVSVSLTNHLKRSSYAEDIAENKDRTLTIREIRVRGAGLAAAVPSVKQLTEEGIRRHRMGKLTIKTRPGVRVEVLQMQHDFQFGSALSRRIYRDVVSAQERDAYFKLFLANFNTGLHENALKWRQMERSRGQFNLTDVDTLIMFCRDNGVYLRGHNILWGSPKFMPPWVVGLGDQQLKDAILQHTRDVCLRYKGKISEWDVINEMLTHTLFKDRLGQDTIDEVYRTAHRADPDAVLYVNEIKKVMTGQLLSQYETMVKGFLARDVPIGGIGLQAYFAHNTPCHLALIDTYARMGRFGLPVKVTELGLYNRDENARASQLEDFFRITFAHPAIDAIIFWGFWAKAHHRPHGALWRTDFSPTPAALTYRRLVFDEWWTTWEGVADQDGLCRLDAFYGRYRIEAGDVVREITWPRRSGALTVNMP